MDQVGLATKNDEVYGGGSMCESLIFDCAHAQKVQSGTRGHEVVEANLRPEVSVCAVCLANLL